MNFGPAGALWDKTSLPQTVSRETAMAMPQADTPETDAQPILLREDIDGVATLTLNRPKQRNSLVDMANLLKGLAESSTLSVLWSHSGDPLSFFPTHPQLA